MGAPGGRPGNRATEIPPRFRARCRWVDISYNDLAAFQSLLNSLNPAAAVAAVLIEPLKAKV